jgi:hypothetical protein
MRSAKRQGRGRGAKAVAAMRLDGGADVRC